MITDLGTGLERLQREAFLVLYNNLNDEINLIEQAWNQLDAQLAIELGTTYEQIELERIQDINFHMGHRPSLIEAPINRYPNVSVMAYQSGAMSPDTMDHLTQYRDRLFIEIMVKSERFQETDDATEQMEAERVVNARIQRTTDAVNNVMQQNKTLNGTLTGFANTPSIVISDVFVRAERTSYGPAWLWQGSRLEYDVSKVARQENSPNGVFREGLEIDQI